MMMMRGSSIPCTALMCTNPATYKHCPTYYYVLDCLRGIFAQSAHWFQSADSADSMSNTWILHETNCPLSTDHLSSLFAKIIWILALSSLWIPVLNLMWLLYQSAACCYGQVLFPMPFWALLMCFWLMCLLSLAAMMRGACCEEAGYWLGVWKGRNLVALVLLDDSFSHAYVPSPFKYCSVLGRADLVLLFFCRKRIKSDSQSWPL